MLKNRILTAALAAAIVTIAGSAAFAADAKQTVTLTKTQIAAIEKECKATNKTGTAAYKACIAKAEKAAAS